MDDFALKPGAHFAKVFKTADGELLVTLEPNDSGNACYRFRMWTDEGFATASIGIEGPRAVEASDILAANFETTDAEKALAAFRMLMQQAPTND